jgi:hypothetical protein
VGLGLLCGFALPLGAVAVALLAGLFAALLSDSLGLGGDSAVFGEGADAFVIGAFFGFVAAFLGALVTVSIAIRRSFGVRLVIPLLSMLFPSVFALVMLGAIF